MLRQKLGDYSFQICIHVVNSVNRANRTATLRFSDVRVCLIKKIVLFLFCFVHFKVFYLQQNKELTTEGVFEK